MNFRDVEALSEYLDGRLGSSDAAKLEARLAHDPNLQIVLTDLRTARRAARAVLPRKAPRSFALRPGMRGLAVPTPAAFPVLRFASVLASLLFLGTLAINGLVPLAASRQAAPAAAYGMGGGGAPQELATPAPPAAAPAATTAPLLSAAPSLGPDATRVAPDLQAKSFQQPPPAPPPTPRAQPPIPSLWQWGIAALAILLAVVAWAVYASASHRFVRKMTTKPPR